MATPDQPAKGDNRAFEEGPQSAYDPAGPLTMDDAEFAGLRRCIIAGVGQARRGELAEGTGEDAIRRVFAAARR